MHDGSESHSSIVPAKQPNKAEACDHVGYGETLHGTQVETPDTVKGEPEVGIQAYAEAAEGGEGRGWPRGTWAGKTGARRSAGDFCNARSTGYGRRKHLCVNTRGKSAVR
jgi:hypothetical protein